jgi:hypothetical protein
VRKKFSPLLLLPGKSFYAKRASSWYEKRSIIISSVELSGAKNRWKLSHRRVALYEELKCEHLMMPRRLELEPRTLPGAYDEGMKVSGNNEFN